MGQPVPGGSGRVIEQPLEQGLLDVGAFQAVPPHQLGVVQDLFLHAYAARPKAVPGDRSADTHDRVRTDRIDNTGLVTLRHQGRLYHIGIGRPHAGTRVLLLVQDLHIRVINAGTGELLRELTLNPDKRYQPTGRPQGWPNKKTPRPLCGFAVSSMSCDITPGTRPPASSTSIVKVATSPAADSRQ